jgi:hypothetical protein
MLLFIWPEACPAHSATQLPHARVLISPATRPSARDARASHRSPAALQQPKNRVGPAPLRSWLLPRTQAATWAWAGKLCPHLGRIWPDHREPSIWIGWLPGSLARSKWRRG